MIKVEFVESSAGEFLKYYIEGHANYADKGEDIVCAAFSSLSNVLLNLAAASSEVKIDEENAGLEMIFAKVAAYDQDTEYAAIQKACRAVYEEMRHISESFPDNVSLKLVKEG